MAHITEIIIEGLLGRDDGIKIKLNRDVNIFFGENGCGKTTLLKILDAALSRNEQAMLRLPVRKAIIDIYSMTEDRIIRHTWERRESKGSQSEFFPNELVEAGFFDSLGAKEYLERTGSKSEWKLTHGKRAFETRSSSWAHTFLPTTRLYLGERAPIRSRAQQLSEEEFDQLFSDSVNRAWLRFYSETLAAVREIQETGLRTVLKQVLDPPNDTHPDDRQDSRLIYERVQRFLARQSGSAPIHLGSASTFRRRYETDDSLRRIVDNLGNVEREIERAMEPMNNFLSAISSLLSRGKTLRMTNELTVTLTDGRSLSIAGLSSGEKHLIKLLFESLTAGPNSVIIDEPELSMHIDWQKSFVKIARSLNPDCQLILASHSPEIMAEIEDRCIFKL